ncbi:MAG: glutamine synthetase [Clostridia bacterium]|nr:glutamine synthetase [Clostridia bacterium]MBR5044744.1 glutamine synthetase [Clostridia bacterium]
MNYSKEEVMQYVAEEDVKFIRLAFCDVFGKQKNISIMPEELPRAFSYGIAFDASAIAGFGDEKRSDLFLHPDPSTLTWLPWRPEHGKVVRMFCSISYPDGTPFECDTRTLLKKAVEDAKAAGYAFYFGAEQEFYLFELDEKNDPTRIPYDRAGYMDIAPEDRGENVRREICLTLEQMGIRPESSHHEEGPGQNEIDFRYTDALSAADNVMTFQTVVRTVARRNGVYADFSPKPLDGVPGNGFHINWSVKPDNEKKLENMIAGILEKIVPMTVFLNSTEGSYARLGQMKAPRFVSWSHENRSQLVRIPAAEKEYRRAELRSPDPAANPYIAFALMIWAGLYGIKNGLALPAPVDLNLYQADKTITDGLQKLPDTLGEAKAAADSDAWIKECLPEKIRKLYCKG